MSDHFDLWCVFVSPVTMATLRSLLFPLNSSSSSSSSYASLHNCRWSYQLLLLLVMLLQVTGKLICPNFTYIFFAFSLSLSPCTFIMCLVDVAASAGDFLFKSLIHIPHFPVHICILVPLLLPLSKSASYTTAQHINTNRHWVMQPSF